MKRLTTNAKLTRHIRLAEKCQINMTHLFIMSSSLFALNLGCASLNDSSWLQRSMASGYGADPDFHLSSMPSGSIQRNPAQAEPTKVEFDPRLERERLELSRALQELGPKASAQEVALRRKLYAEEARLERSSRADREQYYRAKPLLADDRERLFFLRLPDQEARSRWLEQNQISLSHPTYSGRTQKLIDQGDIEYGMTRAAVRESWGEPESIEVAGDPLYGNEIWLYVQEVPTPDGYLSENRKIFFEGGSVVGWDRN